MHPNLSKAINQCLEDPTRKDDLDLRTIDAGVTVIFHTRNTRYSITKLTNGHWLIEGNKKYFPVPTECRIDGSSWAGMSWLKVGYIGVGMRVEIMRLPATYGKQLLTSPVTQIGDRYHSGQQPA